MGDPERKEISDNFKFTWSEHIKFMNGGLIALATGSLLFFMSTMLTEDSVLHFESAKVKWLFAVGMGLLATSLVAGVFWRWLFHLLMDREVIGYNQEVENYLIAVGTDQLKYRFKKEIGKWHVRGHRFLPWLTLLPLFLGLVAVFAFVAWNL